MTLNHSQDLGVDLADALTSREDHRLLNKLLEAPGGDTYERFFTAVRWFNAANRMANDDSAAINDLSNAFEALFKLPKGQTTDRLVDAISLLLGRTTRLKDWAEQFYDARSEVTHEGRLSETCFRVRRPAKEGGDSLYQSLLSYGRQVFQLCLATLLFGAELAEDADLAEKFVTNQERFRRICKELTDRAIEAAERIRRVAPIINSVDRYRFIREDSRSEMKTMISAARNAACALLDYDRGMPQETKEYFEGLVSAERTDSHSQELEALKDLETLLQGRPFLAETDCHRVVSNIIKVVWSFLRMDYYRHVS